MANQVAQQPPQSGFCDRQAQKAFGSVDGGSFFFASGGCDDRRDRSSIWIALEQSQHVPAGQNRQQRVEEDRFGTETAGFVASYSSSCWHELKAQHFICRHFDFTRLAANCWREFGDVRSGKCRATNIEFPIPNSEFSMANFQALIQYKPQDFEVRSLAVVQKFCSSCNIKALT